MARKKKLNPVAITITGLLIGGVTFAAYKWILKPYLDKRKNLKNADWNQPTDTIDITFENVT
jgi:hypothetical protein